ncbi:hypothetical protein OAN46_02275 [Candidatus Pelagibacter sp.]|nr:hypothetical protein [Candidatus Pelagibacter sp.]
MQKKNNPVINVFTEKLIFFGGVTRSGKSFLGPILSSFKKTEMFICDSAAENIYHLNFLKMIKHDQAKYLFKHIYNEKIYNLNIGRNLNRKNSDYSSIKKNKNKNLYYQRERSSKEGDIKIQEIKKEKNNYPIFFHDILINPSFIFASFPKTKLIFIERHPIDLIFEWKNKRYYGQSYDNPRNTTLAFNYKNKTNYPYWCKGYEEEFHKLKNNYEKTIFLLGKLYFIQKKNYLKYKIKYNKKILLTKFESLVESTDIEIDKISNFLNLAKSKFTKKEIKKQRGNRSSTDPERQIRRKEIMNNISNKYKTKLIELESLYKKK